MKLRLLASGQKPEASNAPPLRSAATKRLVSSGVSDTPRISALQPTKRDPDRLTIKVGGKAVATMNRRHVEDLGLTVGQAWSEELADAVAEMAIYDKAMRDAMRRLARRAMSRGQVRDKLRTLGHDAAVIDRVLARLDELELIDDAAFGRMLIDETRRARPAGPRLLRQKLRQKGLDPELIDRLLAEAEGDVDADADARRLIEKTLPRLRSCDAATRRRRLYGVLARRGFDSDVIQRAMEDAESEIDDEADADGNV